MSRPTTKLVAVVVRRSDSTSRGSIVPLLLLNNSSADWFLLSQVKTFNLEKKSFKLKRKTNAAMFSLLHLILSRRVHYIKVC
jgi:hypothetical protein